MNDSAAVNYAPERGPREVFQRILVPLALESGEARILRFATKLAAQNGATLFLLHVLEPEDSADAAQGVVRGALAEMARVNVMPDVTREILTGVGDPATVILDFERVIPADLVVMRPHGRVTPLRKALGTVSEKVVRESVCPVLAVPGAA
jgi:nucleotide-binding universal stress UspA family protein